jgi:hypothetical protein
LSDKAKLRGNNETGKNERGTNKRIIPIGLIC